MKTRYWFYILTLIPMIIHQMAAMLRGDTLIVTLATGLIAIIIMLQAIHDLMITIQEKQEVEDEDEDLCS